MVVESMFTEAEARRIGLSLGLRLLLANLVGAVVVFADLTLLLPVRTGLGRPGRVATSTIVFAAYMAVSGLLGWLNGSKRWRRVWAWARGAPRAPTSAERAAVLEEPWWQVKAAFVGWLGAAVVFGVLQASYHEGGWRVVEVAGAIVLAGLTTCVITFLLAERALRPVFAVVLAGEPPDRPSTGGVLRRLLLSWGLGSAIPLVMLGFAPFGLDAHARDQLGDRLWAFALVGIAAGGIAIVAVGKSVTEPLQELRAALRRVQADDLDAEVTVDDGGEVGLLQAGFNSMVAGLRERRQIRDLFGRHVGIEVARQALEHDRGLGGERREVSALFVDLMGSTALAQSRPPDEVVDLLNAFFETVVARVEAEGGWVNKFEGDGALCVFGAPVSQQDHAARALRAARTLRSDLLALAAEHPGLDAGVGVSSGTVVAGNIGAEQRYEYTVIGDPVNEAARLTEQAKGRLGRVLASEESVARAGDESRRWVVAAELALRGRAEPTLAYEPDSRVEVADQGAAASALQARSTPSSSTS